MLFRALASVIISTQILPLLRQYRQSLIGSTHIQQIFRETIYYNGHIHETRQVGVLHRVSPSRYSTAIDMVYEDIGFVRLIPGGFLLTIDLI